jgi:hypothetical protein
MGHGHKAQKVRKAHTVYFGEVPAAGVSTNLLWELARPRTRFRLFRRKSNPTNAGWMTKRAKAIATLLLGGRKWPDW